MRNIFEVNPENYSKQRKTKIAWNKVLSVLCAIMVFCTTYAMILPALTADKDALGEEKPAAKTEETDDGIRMQKQITPMEDGSYMLRLEAYVTGLTQIITKNSTADIVMLIDTSGSMTDSLPSYAYEATYDIKTSGTYYREIKDGDNAAHYRVYYCSECKGWYTENHTAGGWNSSSHSKRGTLLTPKTSKDSEGTQFFTKNESSSGGCGGGCGGSSAPTKADVMKQVTKKFIERVASYSDKNRISLVKFASAGSSNFVSDVTKEGNSSGKTQVVKQFTKLNSTGIATLEGQIDNLSMSGDTASDLAMQLANGLLEKDKENASRNEQQFVIMFTDGVPNHGGNPLDEDVANSTIKTAKAIKATGATIYTVGCLEDADADVENLSQENWSKLSDVNKYMHLVSSNFKYANSLTDIGNLTLPADGASNYFAASDVDTFAQSFDQISQEIAEATIKLDETAMLNDYISEQYQLKSTDKKDIGVFTQTFLGKDEKGNLKWGEPEPFNDAIVEINTPDYLTSENASGFVNVKGFDYEKYYVDIDQPAESEHVGKKLIVFIPIVAGEGVQPGMNDTNAEGSGIYSKGDDGEYHKSSKDLPKPKVETPAQITMSLSAEHQATIKDKTVAFKVIGANDKKNYVDINPDEYVEIVPLETSMDTAVTEFNLGKGTSNKKTLYAIDHFAKGEENPQKTKVEIAVPDGYILYVQSGESEKQLLSVDSASHKAVYEFVPTGVMGLNFILDYCPTVALTLVNDTPTASDGEKFAYTVKYKDFDNNDVTAEFELPANASTATADLSDDVKEKLSNIPLHSDVTIIESGTDGYSLVWRKDSVSIGYEAECKIENPQEDLTVTIQNTTYMLPATGGNVRNLIPYVATGVSLIVIAIIGLIAVKRKKFSIDNN